MCPELMSNCVHTTMCLGVSIRLPTTRNDDIICDKFSGGFMNEMIHSILSG